MSALQADCAGRSLHKIAQFGVSHVIAAYGILGLVAGTTAIHVFRGTGAGAIEKIAVGIVGALVAGALYDALTGSAPGEVTVDGLLVGTVGSVVILVTYLAVFRGDIAAARESSLRDQALHSGPATPNGRQQPVARRRSISMSVLLEAANHRRRRPRLASSTAIDQQAAPPTKS
jgi:uncharacterized membrane protein YeaQ/YmgE (transglycosylase-associated protein family)